MRNQTKNSLSDALGKDAASNILSKLWMGTEVKLINIDIELKKVVEKESQALELLTALKGAATYYLNRFDELSEIYNKYTSFSAILNQPAPEQISAQVIEDVHFVNNTIDEFQVLIEKQHVRESFRDTLNRASWDTVKQFQANDEIKQWSMESTALMIAAEEELVERDRNAVHCITELYGIADKVKSFKTHEDYYISYIANYQKSIDAVLTSKSRLGQFPVVKQEKSEDDAAETKSFTNS